MKKNLEAVNTSVLKISTFEYGPNGVTQRYAHCCLYANKLDKSYLVLNKHSFPYEEGKRFEVSLTDSKGRTISLESFKCFPAVGNVDAQILVVDRLYGIPNLCSSDMISPKGMNGDSAVIVCPFDAREVRLKFGTIVGENTIETSTLFSEHGDSGGLIVGPYGVLGILSAGVGGLTYYIPMQSIENIYEDITNKE